MKLLNKVLLIALLMSLTIIPARAVNDTSVAPTLQEPVPVVSVDETAAVDVGDATEASDVQAPETQDVVITLPPDAPSCCSTEVIEHIVARYTAPIFRVSGAENEITDDNVENLSEEIELLKNRLTNLETR